MIKNIIGLRAILALLIVFCHCTNHFEYGCLAVTCFFILSGFFMGMKYCSVEGYDYDCQKLKNTLIKVMPLNIAMLIVFVFLQLFILQMESSKLALSFIVHLFCMQDWLPVKIVEPLNGPSWYLSVYIFIMLVFYVFCKIRENTYMKWLFILLPLVFWLINIDDNRLTDCHNWYYYSWAPIRLIDFEVGILMGMNISRFRTTCCEKYSLFVQLIALVIFIFPIRVCSSLYIPYCFSEDVIFIPGSATIVLVLYITNNRKTLINNILELDVTQKLGNISFEIFLIHYFFVRVFASTNLINNLYLSFLGVCILSIGTSIFAKRFFEEPIWRYLKRK